MSKVKTRFIPRDDNYKSVIKVSPPLYNVLKNLKNFSQCELAYRIAGYLYSHAFEIIRIPQKTLLGWGFSRRDIAAAKRFLLARGIIEKVRNYSYKREICEEFQFNVSYLQEFYPTYIFFPDFERAVKGKYQKHQKIRVSDPEIRDYLKKLKFYWSGPEALKLLLNPNKVPPEKRQSLWRTIYCISSRKDVKCNWEEITWDRGGGIYSNNPNLQGIPKIFRKPQILAPPRKELYEIDFVAQYLNIIRIRSGKKPLENPWEQLTKKTGKPKEQVKGVINPYFQGQRKGEYLHYRMQKGEYTPEDSRNYDDIMEAMKKLGLRKTEGKYGLLTLRNRIFLEILKQLIRKEIPAILLLHDGIIIRGKKEALKTQECFCRGSYSILQEELPVRVNIL